ncbi:alpha/beta fold hydrolase [Actomonas aquatica]|uniref:Alpha/beta fold hydrolase n=1 Tax=Actomonas aquatica TaxID=2866162 RepID=A0ABZ1CA43_9BACT|nr:alpha/beta fold hydrolase [Opitutus sp. WL0086]WRQ87459.1 alpha/beta fold hydrolase [Opitutus sp. WL0086]
MKTLPRLLSFVAAVLLAGSIAVHADDHAASRSAAAPQKLTFVLVHGATAGGYEWKKTGRHLEEAGHTVYRVTLTALGERSHLSAENVNLTTHINDVVNTILFEDLHDVVLTGHSYGGMVITGVMDRIPERIRHVFYFDAVVPDDGKSMFDMFGNAEQPDRVVKNGRWIPPWLNENPTTYPHNVGHPIGTLTEPVSYKDPAALALNVTYVPFVQDPATADENSGMLPGWKRAKARGWTIRPYRGSHVAMLETPAGLAELILAAVDDRNTTVD